ncbi:unnamed protein product [Acanthosepion pharaonis]|uniref:Uncharacterized protein n=1 Tax=Acanthosepion pharaonis TaxID=158019 RepID=A0A812BEP0_ACAPH|nr:unnamed protein product [Sepia pharaonis]
MFLQHKHAFLSHASKYDLSNNNADYFLSFFLQPSLFSNHLLIIPSIYLLISSLIHPSISILFQSDPFHLAYSQSDLSIYLSIYLLISSDLSISIYLPIPSPSIYLVYFSLIYSSPSISSICLFHSSIYLSIHLLISSDPSIYLSISSSIYLLYFSPSIIPIHSIRHFQSDLSIHPSIPIHLSICLFQSSIYLSPSICLFQSDSSIYHFPISSISSSIYSFSSSICLTILSIYLFIHYLSIYLSTYFSLVVSIFFFLL